MIFNKNKIYNFMGVNRITFAITLTLLVISIISFATKGIKYGLDFTGGTLLEVAYETPVDLDKVRGALEAGGYHGAVVQNFGSEKDIMIRMQREGTPTLGSDVLAVLQADGSRAELSRAEYVGPQVGDQLKSQGLLALALAMIAVAIYVAFRFQLKFAFAANLALLHDVIITVGCFSLFGWEYDLNILAAVLAVIGYSLNDTIVVYDRIRENMISMRKASMVEIINVAVSETLSRTITTSFLAFLTVLALFFKGGEMLWGFSVALIIGIIFGTYSSIYVASGLLLVFKVNREDVVSPTKEQEEYDTP